MTVPADVVSIPTPWGPPRIRGDVTALIEAFRRMRVVVLGEAILDGYHHGTADRLCREAPVPIVTVTERRDVPGGAANTAANTRALGAEVRFLSVVGDDAEGDLLRAALHARGVAADAVIASPVRRTLAKHRVVASEQTLLRYDTGTTECLTPEDERRLVAALRVAGRDADAVICSDYGYGILTDAVLRELGRHGSSGRRLLVVDGRDLGRYRPLGPAAVKPNYREAADLVGEPILADPEGRAEQVATWGERLLDRTGASVVAVTLDRDGALVFERGGPMHRTYSRPTHDSRAAGAGDTFVGALGLALAAGASATEAAEIASAAAEVVTGKDGTSTCSSGELLGWFTAGQKYVDDAAVLVASLEARRVGGARVVFTNGCFDILHRGHIAYLSRAKALGDVLVVGLNGDDSVRRLKGPQRPINTLEDRAQILSALSCVDHIVPFEEDSPVDLIARLRPDVYVKGGDYTLETLPEAALVRSVGGEVRILPFVEERSTTSIIERIRARGA